MLTNTTVTSIRDRSNEGTLLDAHKQWAKRPADERHTSLESAERATVAHHAACRTATVDVRSLRAEVDGEEIFVVGKTGSKALPTHHAFGQLAARAHAPAGYLRTLRPALAAECLNEGLANADEEQGAKLLIHTGGTPRAMGITSDKYVRVWGKELVHSLQAFVQQNPGWGAPEAFRKAVGAGDVQHAWGKPGEVLPCAYISAHDQFFFLVDYSRPIEVGGSTLARGFFLQNSEVGAGALSLTTFLLDFVCCNSIVWGAKAAMEINLRHVGDVRAKALSDLGAAQQEIRALAASSSDATVEQIRRAQRTLVGDTQKEVISTLFARRIPALTKASITEAIEVAESTPRYGDPRSVWGVVNGLTEVSQRTRFADDRIALDRAAGAVLEMAF